MSAMLKRAARSADLTLVSTNVEAIGDPLFIVVDSEMAPQTKAQVIGLATRANLQLQDMHRSAAAFCITVFQCREAHGSSGWGEFVKRNFTRLSESNMRNAVRAGKLLTEQIGSVQGEASQQQRLERMSRLSRSALFALADASPETASRVVEQLEDAPSEKQTAAKIRCLEQESAISKAEFDEASSRMTAELAELNDKLLQAQQVIDAKEADRLQLERQTAEQAAMIRAAGDAVIALRKEKADAERKTRPPVQAVEDKLSPGVQSAAEALQKIQRDIADETSRRDKLVSQMDTTRRALQEVQRSFGSHKQAADALSKMKDDVSRVLQNYPTALVTSMTTDAPTIKTALKEIAAGLRTFADRISPMA